MGKKLLNLVKKSRLVYFLFIILNFFRTYSLKRKKSILKANYITIHLLMQMRQIPQTFILKRHYHHFKMIIQN